MRALSGLAALTASFAVVWFFSQGPVMGPRPLQAERSGNTAAFAGDLFVAFKAEVSEAGRRETLAALGLTWLETYALTGTQRVSVGSGSPDEASRRLMETGLVRYAEPNPPLRVSQTPDEPETESGFVPDDPLFADQAWFLNLLDAPGGWAITLGDRSIVVAVLDGAVDLDHPDLVDSIWTNPGEVAGNGVDDDENGYVDDLHGYDFIGAYQGPGDRVGEDSDPDVKAGDSAAGDGLDQDGDGMPDGAVSHGTQVAGVIAAMGNNGIGIAGVAWNVSVMPVRVTGPEGNGFFNSFVSALEYAVANGADVVNISLESNFLPLTVKETVAAAAAAGLIMVGAAGNTGFTVSFPAKLDEVIAVGSTRGELEPDLRALFSPVTGEVEFVAPGIDIPTLAVEAVTGEPTYGTATGTSFSAPMVTGLVALIKSLRPTATVEDVRTFLREGAVDLPDIDAPFWDGFGRINFAASLAAALAGPLPAPILDSAVAAETAIEVRGRAVPEAIVTLMEEAEGLLETTTASVSGAFGFAIERDSLRETTAVLELIATVEGRAGVSPASEPLVVNVTRDSLLVPGWNLVAWPGASGTGLEVFAGLPTGVERVFAWDGLGWDIHVPGSSFLRIDEVVTGEGLWIFVTGAQVVQWRQVRVPYATTPLVPGWQLVAWPGPRATLGEGLQFTSADVVSVFGWDPFAKVFETYQAALPQAASLGMLAHLDAVWLLVGESGGDWPGP